jgi:hypothetical protein
MTLKAYLMGIRISTLAALVGWGLVVYFIDPEKTGIIGASIFYLSAFLSFAGIAILFLTWTRKKYSGSNFAFSHVGMSFRQGILLSGLVIILMILQSLGMLVWWDGLLATAGIFLIELYFLSR